ncbi:MAG: glutamate-5-semialdehyde dehydrogenase [Clostridia bacterium]|nr:glutamate-5-semialdehyde dehydrogenase [Clostridia bacterium]
MTTAEILNSAKKTKAVLSSFSALEKNQALLAMADALIKEKEVILAENAKDVEAARGTVSDVMIDRLMLTEARIEGMAEGIRAVAKLPDPVGRVLESTTRPNGLLIEKVSVALGVVAIIYESRPNVTSDAAALCLKSGNVCVLRSGKEAYASAHAIVDAMRKGLASVGFPETAVNILDDTSRAGANELMKARGYVDMLIPRGGAGLIRACVENATVPCIETGTGICHIYVDKSADMEKAISILVNAKTSRPSVCNAAEVCLVHAEIADTFLPMLKQALCDDRAECGKQPVELRLDERAARIITGTPAGVRDFDTEFLDYILAVAVVDDVKDAVMHVLAHSTGHSEAIIAEDEAAQNAFVSLVDSAAVYINASTRFTDGGEFGLGCEMGISTQKLHARGPMGLAEMTSYQYRIKGNGQIR